MPIPKPPTRSCPDGETIEIHGARTNNLKNISLRIPRNKLVVVTGRSGSGKSSLALGTLFAEGQRQYIESLSLHSRQFFDQIPRAEVDLIEGLQPTLSLDQHQRSATRRSTVGTTSDIADFLRVLFARAGQVHCHQCHREIDQQTPQQIRDWAASLPEQTKIMLLAPLVTAAKGNHGETIAAIRRERLVRVRLDGDVHDIDRLPEIDPSKEHDIEAVVDRIIVRPGVEGRLLEAVELATRLSDGLVTIVYRPHRDVESNGDWQDSLFSTRYACRACGLHYPEIEPRTFSFNSPYGACQQCDGLGAREQFALDRVIKDRSLSLDRRAIIPWSTLSAGQYKKKLSLLAPIMERFGLELATTVERMTEPQRDEFFFSKDKASPGLITILEKELATAVDDDLYDRLMLFRQQIECPECGGSRLCPQANSVLVQGRSIGELSSLTLNNLAGVLDPGSFIDSLDSEVEIAICRPLLDEIEKRLSFLNQVGVGYLTLGRAGNTLSGGELQRVRLATSIGNSLTSVCYVLDEPTIGLHPSDSDRLLESLRTLQRAGNSVVVVEHDEAVMRAADHLIDIGPEAGKAGGWVIAEGSVSDLVDVPKSLTGQYLGGRRKIERRATRRTVSEGRLLELTGATGFNLRGDRVTFPLGTLIAITGVSGSGKSTLINRTLYPALAARLEILAPEPEPYESMTGAESIDSLLLVDQRPIGRSPRGCAATYTGIMTALRKLFAATKLAKQRGYGATRFSFNDKSGACPECKGLGRKQLKMNFLADIEIECETCRGARYNPQTLQVRFRNHSIADLLRMSVDEARAEFENIESIHQILNCLSQVGLGYLPLGQSATTLSGGEAQRIKLASELAKRESGKRLYLLDEPTTGLHFEDVRGLVTVLDELVELGNTVIVIEHNLDLIRVSDWVVDLGPNGGDEGGAVVVMGTPEQVAESDDSLTGKFLKPLL